ncbi:MAG TPA: YetF domain-containing protein [Tepidisphaeraceae bacterium]|nr:YetF domain-containing protein [Tepidisphaeraceae bacterium]
MLAPMLHFLADATDMPPSAWHDMFHLTLPIVEKILRTIIVYFALMLGLRISGKRELAQLNPFDLIVLLMLSNTVQNAIIGDDNTVTGGIIGAITLLSVNYLIVRLVYRSPMLQRFFGGEAEVLVRHGHIRKHKLEQELITPEELEAAAHRQGISSLTDVEKCILEPTGTISFIERKPTTDEERHEQLVKQIEQLTQIVTKRRAAMAARANGRVGEYRGASRRNGSARSSS